MGIYNQFCLGILITVSFGIFFIIILIRRWFINYSQDQIVILRGVLEKVDSTLSELPGEESVRILFLLKYGRLADGCPTPILYFFSLKISRVGGIYYTIIIIL